MIRNRRFFRTQHSPRILRDIPHRRLKVVDAGTKELKTGNRGRSTAGPPRNTPVKTAQSEQRERVFKDLPYHSVEVCTGQLPKIGIRDDLEAPYAEVRQA